MANNDSSILHGIQHLKRARDYFDVFLGQCVTNHSKSLIRGYIRKMAWIQQDLLSEGLGEDVKAALKEEYNVDVWLADAICEKIALVPASQREMLEKIVDVLVSGESLTMIDEPKKQ